MWVGAESAPSPAWTSRVSGILRKVSSGQRKMAKLNPDVLDKMVRASRKPKQYIREQISRRAGRLAVSSLAAQLLWARELGIGITHALNRAGSSVRDEIRTGATAATIVSGHASQHKGSSPQRRKNPKLSAATINFLLEDTELKDRCRDLLLAKKHYDRVLREATTVLDDRLKKVSGISNMNPSPLVGKVLSPDPSRAVVVVSAEKDEQEGFFYICRGVMQTFRNKTHHNLTNAFTQADALKFCGFIDTILALIANGKVYLDRV